MIVAKYWEQAQGPTGASWGHDPGDPVIRSDLFTATEIGRHVWYQTVDKTSMQSQINMEALPPVLPGGGLPPSQGPLAFGAHPLPSAFPHQGCFISSRSILQSLLFLSLCL